MENKACKIVLCSDSHGLIEPLNRIQEIYPDAFLLHCGDSELPDSYVRGFAFVHGNNDWISDAPYDRILTIGDHKIFLTHGHHYLYWNDMSSLVRKAKVEGCDVCCFGHTHVYCDEVIDGVRMLNPGSLRSNRDGTLPSFMEIEIQGESVNVKRKEASSLFSFQK